MSSAAILVAVEGSSTDDWFTHFRVNARGRDLRRWPHAVGDPMDIAYACVWRAPHGLLAGFPNLRVIFNLGAGVDHILADPRLPALPIVRVVHSDLSMRMTEYVVLHVLIHHRRQLVYAAQQHMHIWKGHEQPPASDVAVGVMGLGAIGIEAARVLARLGFRVGGWSRTPKALAGIETFHGAAGLDPFLARTEILVCLLPQTPETEGMLDIHLLRKLRRDGAAGGAFLVNAARGKLQVDADILAALDEGTLAGATLDVFQQEPLPATNPFWDHPKVTVTPHNAGDLSPRVLARHVLAQIECFEAGRRLENIVDRQRGY